jgi:anti-sigma factor RsiW
MMTCADVEDHLLEAIDEGLPGATRQAVDQHLASCGRCAAFAAKMRALDLQLASAIRPLEAPPSIAAGVIGRQRRERREALAGSLPDIIHLTGCALATLLSALLLPVEASVTLAVGVAFTCFTYVVMAVVRLSLEAVDQPDW